MQPSLADYWLYHQTEKDSTKLSFSTTKPSEQVGSTKAFTTARKTQPQARKEIEKETLAGLTLHTECPNQRR